MDPATIFATATFFILFGSIAAFQIGYKRGVRKQTLRNSVIQSGYEREGARYQDISYWKSQVDELAKDNAALRSKLRIVLSSLPERE